MIIVLRPRYMIVPLYRSLIVALLDPFKRMNPRPPALNTAAVASEPASGSFFGVQALRCFDLSEGQPSFSAGGPYRGWELQGPLNPKPLLLVFLH